MKKKVTLKDIADIAGVSTASVSMILNGKQLDRFSSERINKVLETAKSLGYYPLSSRKKQIAIISPGVLNPYHTAMITGIDQAAVANGYYTAVYNTYWNPETELYLLDNFDYNQIAGIVFAAMPMESEKVRLLSKRVPIVAVGDRIADLGIDTVDVDNYGAAQMVAKHLISLGHKHIAYATTRLDEHHISRVRRAEGLKAAYKAFCPDGSVSIICKNNPIELEISKPDLEYYSGVELAHSCLEDPKITAIVAINDMVAYGVLDALLKEGYRVPEDYSLCGFDNAFPSHLQRMQLTSVENFSINHGKSAFRLIQQRIENRSEDELGQLLTRIEYESVLIQRGSTAPPRDKH